MHRCIECVNGLCEGMVCPLKGRVTIGRSEGNRIKIPGDREMSRHHACVSESSDGRAKLEDLGSHNGTFVGVSDRRITTALLQPGESFRVGESNFIYVVLSKAEFKVQMEKQLLKTGSDPAAELTRTTTHRSVLNPCPHPSHRALDKRFRFCPTCGKKL